jgi:hypothetical protein
MLSDELFSLASYFAVRKDGAFLQRPDLEQLAFRMAEMARRAQILEHQPVPAEHRVSQRQGNVVPLFPRVLGIDMGRQP